MDRKQHWEQVYRQRQHDEVSWYQPEPVLSLQLIEACHLAPGAAIIDIGGGASTLVDRLLTRSHRNLSVLDISGQALQIARQRLGANASGIHWLECDIRYFQAPQRYQLWHDRAVFHFLTDAADRRGYLDALENSLHDEGYLIIASFTKSGPRKCSGLDIVQYDAESLSREVGEGFRLLRAEAEIHRTPGGAEQAFQYCLFQRA